MEGFQRSWLRGDIVAGVVLSTLLVPQGMAYAELAGMPAVTGLYATVAAIIGYVIFGSSRQLVLGPDSSVSILVASTVIAVAGGEGDVSRTVALAGVLAIIMGMFLVLGGIFNVGFVARFLSASVMAGYTNALALIIIVGQLPKILGFSIEADEFFPQIAEILQNLDQTQLLSVVVGVASLAVILVCNRFYPRVPGVLIAVVGATVITAWLGLEQYGLQITGEIPTGLPGFSVPAVSWADIQNLIGPAIAVAIMAFADTALTSKQFAQRGDYRVNINQDLIGLGTGNILCGFFGAFSVSSSGSRTAVSDSSGGKSQFANLTAAFIVVLVLLFLAPLFRTLPSATLGAVVISAALSLFDFETLKRTWNQNRNDFWIAVVTLGGALAFGLLNGIIIAVVLSVLSAFLHSATVEAVEMGRGTDPDDWRSVERWPEVTTEPGIVVLRYDSALFFANAELFGDQVHELVDRSASPVRYVVWDAEASTSIDFTGTEVLSKLVVDLAEDGVTLMFAAANSDVTRELREAGIVVQMGAENLFVTTDAAVNEAMARMAESPAVTPE
jgi:high affinity sulfate transporter 1